MLEDDNRQEEYVRKERGEEVPLKLQVKREVEEESQFFDTTI